MSTPQNYFVANRKLFYFLKYFKRVTKKKSYSDVSCFVGYNYIHNNKIQTRKGH